MIVPARLDLSGDRFTDFRTTVSIVGMDLTGAVFEAHIRETKDMPGDPLADLDEVGSISTEGIYLVSVATVDGVTISTFSMHIDEATMEAMSQPGVETGGNVGDDFIAFWDIHITPAGDIKRVYASGTFTVRAGVTQPAGWS